MKFMTAKFRRLRPYNPRLLKNPPMERFLWWRVTACRDGRMHLTSAA
jgi:hypothetical protein